MDFIREVFSIPFGYLIGFFYELSDNYLLSLLLMTLCVKLVLLPSSIKQQKGMVKTQRMQPKIKRIREKYAGNQQKMNEAMNELYAKEGYSSMTGGCSGMLIQLPVMMGVYFVNYKILSYVLNIKGEVLEAIKSAARLLPEYKELVTNAKGNTSGAEYRLELLAIEHFDKLDLSGVPAEVISKIDNFVDNFTLFGIDLSRTPTTDMGWDLLWLIPILTGLTSLAMGVYTFIRQKKTNPEMAKNPSMGCMSLMTPAMSIYFSFLFPASVGVYIILSSFFSFVQMLVMNKVFSPKKVLAKTMVEETINRRAREKIFKNVAETLSEDDNN
ncbi:MAG: YidC/Oxa1 family membrane protein insertase [Clostridia bacterium]|nr:YidC/Oxa1 family membrane protein insertase [Clostridia bacterium]